MNHMKTHELWWHIATKFAVHKMKTQLGRHTVGLKIDNLKGLFFV